MNSDNIDLIKDFLGSEFHQDWDLESSSPDDVVTAYIEKSSGEHLRMLGNSLISYLKEIKNDDELDSRLFSELKCEFYPKGIGLSTRDWLQSLARRFLEVPD